VAIEATTTEEANMKTAIRMMVCLAMTATSTAVFANGEGPASSSDADAKEVQASERESYAAAKRHEDVGAASGEPLQVGDRKQDDKRAQNVESIDEYNHRRFLEEVWTRP
jgi:hypothetical protein